MKNRSYRTPTYHEEKRGNYLSLDESMDIIKKVAEKDSESVVPECCYVCPSGGCIPFVYRSGHEGQKSKKPGSWNCFLGLFLGDFKLFGIGHNWRHGGCNFYLFNYHC